MSSNFPPAPHSDVVQGALALQPGKSSFHSLPLFAEGLPLGGLVPPCFTSHQALVSRVNVDHGLRSVLPTNQSKQFLRGVTHIGHPNPWMKLRVSEPSFTKHVGGSALFALDTYPLRT